MLLFEVKKEIQKCRNSKIVKMDKGKLMFLSKYAVSDNQKLRFSKKQKSRGTHSKCTKLSFLLLLHFLLSWFTKLKSLLLWLVKIVLTGSISCYNYNIHLKSIG